MADLSAKTGVCIVVPRLISVFWGLWDTKRRTRASWVEEVLPDHRALPLSDLPSSAGAMWRVATHSRALRTSRRQHTRSFRTTFQCRLSHSPAADVERPVDGSMDHNLSVSGVTTGPACVPSHESALTALLSSLMSNVLRPSRRMPEPMLQPALEARCETLLSSSSLPVPDGSFRTLPFQTAPVELHDDGEEEEESSAGSMTPPWSPEDGLLITYSETSGALNGDEATVVAQVRPSPSSAEQAYSQEFKNPIVSRIVKHLNSKNHQLAMDAFYEIIAANKQGADIEIPPGIAKGLFRLVCPARRPFDVYQVLLYYCKLSTTAEYHEGDGDVSAYAKLYERACDSLRYLEPSRHSRMDCLNLVSSLASALQRLDRSGQELCCPTMVSALVEQKCFAVGAMYARPIYLHIVEQNFAVPDGFWVHLLSHSRFNRQGDLPFEDVLTRMVDTGRRPRPLLVLNALDNFFPFTDVPAVTKALKAIFRLQQQVVEASKSDDQHCERYEGDQQYFVDIGTLELIGATAANQGQSNVNLLVWDMLDILGYEATVGIYENTVAAFAMNTFTYREAFTVLAEMEARGFRPTRALIRSFSVQLRCVFCAGDAHLFRLSY